MFGYKGVAVQKSLRCPNMDKIHKQAYYYVQAFNMRHAGETVEETWKQGRETSKEEDHVRFATEAKTHVHTEFADEHKPEVEIIHMMEKKKAENAKADAEVLQHLSRVTKRSTLVKRQSMAMMGYSEREAAGAVHCLKTAYNSLSDALNSGENGACAITDVLKKSQDSTANGNPARQLDEDAAHLRQVVEEHNGAVLTHAQEAWRHARYAMKMTAELPAYRKRPFRVDGRDFGQSTNIFSVYADPELRKTWEDYNLNEANLVVSCMLKRSDHTGHGAPLCQWLRKHNAATPSLMLVSSNEVAKELYDAGATCCIQQNYLAGRVIRATLVAERDDAVRHTGNSAPQEGGSSKTIASVERSPSGMHTRDHAFMDRAQDHKDELEDELRDAVVKSLAQFY